MVAEILVWMIVAFVIEIMLASCGLWYYDHKRKKRDLDEETLIEAELNFGSIKRNISRNSLIGSFSILFLVVALIV